MEEENEKEQDKEVEQEEVARPQMEEEKEEEERWGCVVKPHVMPSGGPFSTTPLLFVLPVPFFAFCKHAL